MMNRREAIGAAIGAAVSFVLPVPRRRLDLLSFCDTRNAYVSRYDLSLPWEHEEWTYATEGHVCLRVRPESGDRRQREGRMPPFGSLSWNHGRLQGWRELPRLTPLLADNSHCPACEGTGFEGGVIGHGCEACDGTGHEWVGDGWHLSVPVPCKGCGGKGVMPPPGARTCPACQGNAIGVFPSVVRLGREYFDAGLYEKVRALGGDFVMDNWNCSPSHPMMRFRFDGGTGLLMGMDRAGAETRLAKGT